ncbi:MAG: hypothetical protein Q8R36_02530 [bacterium]|nr:hypothetical protein [bacterium]
MMFLRAFLCLSVMISVVFTTQVFAHEKWPNTERPHLSEGLKQFPFLLSGQKLVGNVHLVTLRGYGQQGCPQAYKDRECVRFDLVTSEGKDTEVIIILPESEAHRVLFMHEISPDIGKYVGWNPVMLIPILHEQVFASEFPTIYHSHYIGLIGRFYYHMTDASFKGHYNFDTGHYHFERYPHNPH